MGGGTFSIILGRKVQTHRGWERGGKKGGTPSSSPSLSKKKKRDGASFFIPTLGGRKKTDHEGREKKEKKKNRGERDYRTLPTLEQKRMGAHQFEKRKIFQKKTGGCPRIRKKN